MEIKLSLTKDVNENANFYFEKAKKLKAKLPGIEKAVGIARKEIENFEDKKQEYLDKKKKKEKLEANKKKEWYEKFRWTKSASGNLCVLGKDSGTNEILIKKHAEPKDIILHTEAPGSPFCIIKNALDEKENLLLPKDEVESIAQFVLCFSSQWKRGFGTGDAFWVKPKQVSKKAESGEYMAKGSFMIRGEKNIIKNIPLRICLGVVVQEIKTEEGEVLKYEELFSGPEMSCKKFCQRFVKIEHGQLKYKALNKQIKERLKTYVEDLPKYIPAECKILKK